MICRPRSDARKTVRWSTGIVDHNMNRAETIFRERRRGFERIGIGDIGRNWEHLNASLVCDFSSNFFELFLAASKQDGFTPSAANPLVMARPTPLLPPVITASFHSQFHK